MKHCLAFILLFFGLSASGEVTEVITLDEESITNYKFVPAARKIDAGYFTSNADLHVWYKRNKKPFVLESFVNRSRDIPKRHKTEKQAIEEAEKLIKNGTWKESMATAWAIQDGEVRKKGNKQYKLVVKVLLLKHDPDQKVRSWKFRKVPAVKEKSKD